MKIGLVLSGGGIRGIAHLGVLKALKEKKIEISVISGTSAGAIAGAFFANGIDPYDTLQILLKTPVLRLLKFAYGRPGLWNLQSTSPFFKKYLPEDTFEALKIPLHICATNFTTGKLNYFDTGALVEKILASSCVPGIFNPIKIGEDLFIDGGVLNNFPVEPLLKKCTYIIASSCNHLPVLDKIRNMKHVMERAATLVINHDLEEKCKFVDLLIEPKGLGERGIFEISKAEEIYWIAYEETLKQLANQQILKH